jgi:hypothetical protein
MRASYWTQMETALKLRFRAAGAGRYESDRRRFNPAKAPIAIYLQRNDTRRGAAVLQHRHERN